MQRRTSPALQSAISDQKEKELFERLEKCNQELEDLQKKDWPLVRRIRIFQYLTKFLGGDQFFKEATSIGRIKYLSREKLKQSFSRGNRPQLNNDLETVIRQLEKAEQRGGVAWEIMTPYEKNRLIAETQQKSALKRDKIKKREEKLKEEIKEIKKELKEL